MKYWKPTSVTWWASVTPLCAGLFLATEPLHGLAAAAQSIEAMVGGTSPALLINAGLAGIGIRGAMG